VFGLVGPARHDRATATTSACRARSAGARSTRSSRSSSPTSTSSRRASDDDARVRPDTGLYDDDDARGGGAAAPDRARRAGQLITIEAANLFGGKELEGGVLGNLRFYFGSTTQNANAYLETKVANPFSGYRGLCYAVWEHVYLGTTPYLKHWQFVVRRCPTTLGTLAGDVTLSARRRREPGRGPLRALDQHALGTRQAGERSRSRQLPRGARDAQDRGHGGQRHARRHRRGGREGQGDPPHDRRGVRAGSADREDAAQADPRRLRRRDAARVHASNASGSASRGRSRASARRRSRSTTPTRRRTSPRARARRTTPRSSARRATRSRRW
jgi:hypothetical protein